MMFSAAILFALGAAAQPHWVQKKPEVFPNPTKTIANIQNKINQGKIMQSAPESRRLQAIMSEECAAACPGVPDMIKAMTEGRRLDGHGEMMKMCPYVDTIACMEIEGRSACKEEHEQEVPEGTDKEEEMDGFKCMCAVPDVMDMCKDMSGIMSKVKAESACSAILSTVDETEMTINCEYENSGCEEIGEKVAVCAGDELMEWAKHECDTKVADEPKCCEAAPKIVECMDKKCITLQMAALKHSADKGDKDAKEGYEDAMKNGDACPDAGMPTESEVTSKVSSSSGDTSSASTDFAARGQTVSMLTLAALIALSMMA